MKFEYMVRQLILLVFLIGLDLYSKHLLFDMPWKHMAIFSFFSLTLAKNTGASFGLAADQVDTIIVINVTILFFVLYFFVKESDLKTKTAWTMILSGGIANLYDRVCFGYVRDFLHFHIGQYSWPIFNLADCYISLAVLHLLFFTQTNYQRLNKL